MISPLGRRLQAECDPGKHEITLFGGEPKNTDYVGHSSVYVSEFHHGDKEDQNEQYKTRPETTAECRMPREALGR